MKLVGNFIKRNLFIIGLTVLLFLQPVNSFCQGTKGNIYKNLKIKKRYLSKGEIEYKAINGKIVESRIDGKLVDSSLIIKYLYNPYHDTNCRPCIIKTYDYDNKLVSEAVACGECGVGYLKIFYPNGKLKRFAQLSKSPTGNWDSLIQNRICFLDGPDIYFNEKGDTLYTEYWKNNVFIKQVPEQKVPEIWTIDIILNGKLLKNEAILSDQVKSILITPRYKNRSRNNSNISLKLQMNAAGKKPFERDFTLDNFKNIDIKSLKKEGGFDATDSVVFTLFIYLNDKFYMAKELNIKD